MPLANFSKLSKKLNLNPGIRDWYCLKELSTKFALIVTWDGFKKKCFLSFLHIKLCWGYSLEWAAFIEYTQHTRFNLIKLVVKYVPTYTKGTLEKKKKKDQRRTHQMMPMQCFFFSFFLTFFLKAYVDAVQMVTCNICLYKEVNKNNTGCYLKATELLDCALIWVCAVIRWIIVFVKWENNVVFFFCFFFFCFFLCI